MNARPKTIQIFLPHGDARGLRVAEITTRIVQVIEVPRSLLDQFFAMPESKQVGVYFLFGGGEDGSDPRVYVGQTGDLQQRLTSHNKSKEFWERALVLISRTNSLTQTHALFLEWHCLQAATRAGRYESENGNAGSRPHTPAPLEADCMEIFETGQTLMATLGYPLFDAVVEPKAAEAQHVFHVTGRGANGRGIYTPDGFVVLKDSTGPRQAVPSLAGTSDDRLREDLIAKGVMEIEADQVRFTKDYLFRSPSTACMVILGRKSNGWEAWRADDARTLADIHRSGMLRESASGQ